MSNYTRNFGMRSFENVVRDGRFRVPRTGNPLQIGSPVTLDAANPGFLKVAPSATPPGPLSGIAIFEHIQSKGVDTFLTTHSDTPFNLIPLGQYTQMMHGPGTKVWFKNTADKPLYDGRVQTGGGLLASSVDVTAVTIGQGLVPDGSGKFAIAGSGVAHWLTIEQVNPTTGVIEARFGF